jgi:hypothetical protein
MTTLTLDNGRKLEIDMSLAEIDVSLGRTNGICIVDRKGAAIVNWNHVIYAEEELGDD